MNVQRPDRLIMHHISTRMFTAAACLALVSCSNDAEPAPDPDPADGESQTVHNDVSPLDGHWSGSWGGGAQGDVIFQPVLAELTIDGDHVELSGFPDAAELTGTIRYDTDRIVITAAADQILDYSYDVRGDQLTLTDADGRTILLQRRRQVQDTSDRADPPVP
jgi:hypothetical protein